LPVLKRFFSEIAMDFMVELPESKGCCNIWVIKDCLSKTTVLEGMAGMNAEECAKKFLECWVCYHRIPQAITSNCGSN